MNELQSLITTAEAHLKADLEPTETKLSNLSLNFEDGVHKIGKLPGTIEKDVKLAITNAKQALRDAKSHLAEAVGHIKTL